MEVKNGIITDSYDISDSEWVQLIMTCLGPEVLRFVWALPEEKEHVKLAKGIFNILNGTFKHSTMKLYYHYSIES